MNRPLPLESVKLLRLKTDSVIVGFSRGKDSIALLDLCKERFDRVEAFFCYVVPDLEFEERYLRYAERRWDIKIHRMPHWFLPGMIRSGWYRAPTKGGRKCPKLKESDIYDEMRQQTGIDWVATGRKADDSIWRRSTVHHTPSGLFDKRREAWPLVWWSNQAVFNYLKIKAIPLPGEYAACKESIGSFKLPELQFIKQKHPNDFARITRFFPFIESQLAREEFRKGWAESQQASEIHDAEDLPNRTEERPIQPANPE